MRLTAPALILAVLGIAGPLPAQAPTPPVAPKLSVERAEIDLGPVERGREAQAVFHLKNEGDEILRILSAKPG